MKKIRYGQISLISHFFYFWSDLDSNTDVSTMSDKIRLNVDIINIKFKYSDADAVWKKFYFTPGLLNPLNFKTGRFTL